MIRAVIGIRCPAMVSACGYTLGNYEPIKSHGTYTAEVKLYAEISGKVHIKVTEN